MLPACKNTFRSCLRLHQFSKSCQTQNEQKLNARLSHLLTGSSRRGKSEGFLDILSDGHGAEDVEEDEAAVGHVIAQQVAVGQALHPVDRCERQLGHNATVKYRVEHGQEGCEGKTCKCIMQQSANQAYKTSTFGQ